GNEIFRMWFAIHVNGSERMWTTDVEYQDFLKVRHLDDLGSIRGDKLPGPSRRLAACMRFEFISSTVFVEGFCPRLIGRLGVRQTATAAAPNAPLAWKGSQHRMAVGPARCRLGWASGLTATATATRAGLPLSLALTLFLDLLALSLRLLSLSFQQ